MKVRFLLDENLSPRLKQAVLRLNPEIDIIRIGDANTLPLGSLDPEVLRYLERSQRLLVTDNRASMPDHLRLHWQQGRHIWGLLWTRPNTPLQVLAKEIVLVYEATSAEEWLDYLDWIPL
ncbi:MAG: DUF5615 family PIN-like protein [Cyanobacteria bacterium J06643_4]